MRYSGFTELVLSGLLVLTVAACATGPAKSPSGPPSAAAHRAGPTDKSGSGPQQQVLEEQLRIRLAATDATVSSANEVIRLRIPAAAVFADDATGIRPEGRYLLQRIAEVIKGVAGVNLKLVVYGDSLDSPANSRAFTAARALAAASVMQEQGIAIGRLQSQGAGPADPLAGNDTAEERRTNRRLEILISPLSF